MKKVASLILVTIMLIAVALTCCSCAQVFPRRVCSVEYDGKTLSSTCVLKIDVPEESYVWGSSGTFMTTSYTEKELVLAINKDKTVKIGNFVVKINDLEIGAEYYYNGEKVKIKEIKAYYLKVREIDNNTFVIRYYDKSIEEKIKIKVRADNYQINYF